MKENKKQNKSIVASNNNADLADDLGIQKLTRNKPRQKQNLTTLEEQKLQGASGIIVSDGIELYEEKSIGLTDFKSF